MMKRIALALTVMALTLIPAPSLGHTANQGGVHGCRSDDGSVRWLLYGTQNNDVCDGHGTDTSGTEDDDWAWLYDGGDKLTAKVGQDYVEAGSGHDDLDMGDGHDTVYGGPGNDKAKMGDGDDEFRDVGGQGDIDKVCVGGQSDFENVYLDDDDGNDIAYYKGNNPQEAIDFNNSSFDSGDSVLRADTCPF
jgi:hypothetical protein